MDRNSKTNSIDQIIDVMPWNSAEEGYGPLGDYSREAWRKLCWQKLQSGKDGFTQWQQQLMSEASGNPNLKRFELELKLVSGDKKIVSPWGEPFNDAIVPAFGMPCYTLDFSGYNHTYYVHLNQYSFIVPTIFAYSTFNEFVNISNCHFNERVEIGWVKFLANADFTGTRFSNFTKFSQSLFCEYAIYSKCSFESQVLFDLVMFKSSAIFSNSIFKNICVFKGVYFNEFANFELVKFEGRVNFQDSTFKKITNFFKAEFNDQCEFEKSIFEASANFEKCDIQNVGHFENVKFNGEFPNFLGVDNAKTLLIFSDDEYFNKEDTTEDAVKRIGQLKRLADEQGQTDQALMFNKFELNAKRAQARIKTKQLNFLQKLGNSDFWFANATASYDIFSSYGRSFTKPLKYYFGLLLVVYILALGNAVVNSPKNCKAENLRMLSDLWRDDTPCDISKTNPDDKTRLNGYRAAAEYTVYRAAGILDFSDNGKGTDAVARRLFGQSYEPGWMRFVGLVKAIASTALLFLAALGLRNKYRIK